MKPTSIVNCVEKGFTEVINWDYITISTSTHRMTHIKSILELLYEGR